MSIKIGLNPNPNLIVGTLSNSFSAMEKLGDPVIRPFLQDVIQFSPLLNTLVTAGGQDLMTPFKVIPQVGFSAIADFVVHFTALAVYTLLATTVAPVLLKFTPVLPRTSRFQVKRLTEAWKFGSGLDYDDH
jgi:lycopene cyclase CruP